MKDGRSKAKNTSVNKGQAGVTVKMQGCEVVKVEAFKCLGSNIQSKQCIGEVKETVQAGCSGWRKKKSNILFNFKNNFYVTNMNSWNTKELCLLILGLPYDIKHLQLTLVVIWC